MARALSVYMGREAAARIANEGWSADLFSLLLGASGGPKWFILAHLDRLLFGDFLQRSERPLSVLGSSIGAWRHACLAMPDPVAAIERLEQGYLHQRYATKPTTREVSAVSLRILQGILGKDGDKQLVNHPRIRSHIVTARGRGPAAASSTPLLATGMGAAALGNTFSRRLLKFTSSGLSSTAGSSPAPAGPARFSHSLLRTAPGQYRPDTARQRRHTLRPDRRTGYPGGTAGTILGRGHHRLPL